MSELNHIAFVDENSAHDQFLNLLAIVVLVSVLAVGIYWQSLPLPDMPSETEQSETGATHVWDGHPHWSPY